MMSEGYGARTKGIEGDLADKWFSAQKSLFVSAGKTFGDKVVMCTSYIFFFKCIYTDTYSLMQRAVDRRGQPLRRSDLQLLIANL